MHISLELYKIIYRIRRAEESILEHYPSDEMKTPMHMSMGQEAIAAGVCYALTVDDQIFSSYRSHAAFLAKTQDTDTFFAELYGKEWGTAKGKGGSMHVASPEKGHMCSSAIVASCIPVAVGAAFANKQKKNGRITCVFFGDGALDEGVFWESLNVACAMKLPVMFVCEDNNLAVHTFTHVRQGYKSIGDIVSKFEATVMSADTTDVEAVFRLAQEVIRSINQSAKPALLHLKCYRYLEHVGIHEDFEGGYRSREEFEGWLARDCISLQRKRLLENGFSESLVARVEQEIDEEIRRSVSRAKEAPYPKPEELYRGIFHESD